jgi:uncharacterized membrane protein YhiD involved in acid resistance
MVTRLRTISLGLLAVSFAVFTVGCDSQELTPREKMTIAGGVIGAGTGAMIGSVTGPGAAIGAGVGGGIGLLGGAAVGNEIEIVEAKNEQTQTLLQQQEKDLEMQRREMQELKLREERDQAIQNQNQSKLDSMKYETQSRLDSMQEEVVASNETDYAPRRAVRHHARRTRRYSSAPMSSSTSSTERSASVEHSESTAR